jgi:DNA polymerase III alpha subunit
MQHINPCNHPESYLSGSTVETMIDRAKELGVGYFAVTDHGYMSSNLKAYYYGKDNGIKVISGVEIYFKDKDCPILNGKSLSNIKYFKLIIHAKDQEAHQKLVSLSSNYEKTIVIGEKKHKTWTWADLEEISKYNVTICSSNVEDMVIKHMLMGKKEAGIAYFQKLNALFKDRYYLSIIPFSYNKHWTELVQIKLSGNKVINLKATDRVETNKYDRGTAKNLTYKKDGTDEFLHAIYINKIRYSVKPEHSKIISVKYVNDFQDIPDGDIQFKANRIAVAIAKQFNMLDKLLINDYSYYAQEDDKVVQDMKLGEENRIYQAQFMRSKQDVDLTALELNYDDLAKNSVEWAKNFDSFVLKYDYKLADVGEDPVGQLMQAIKDTGRDKLLENPIYKKQFEEELKLLTDNGVLNLVPYFLPIVDISKHYNKNKKLVGPSRGSSGGFLLAYLCGVTHIDPIKYKLSSSRFLTLGRVKSGRLPDVDWDCEDRGLLVGEDGNSGYLERVYGDKFAQCSTRSLLRIKSAILDANRFVNNGKIEDSIQKLSKTLPNTPQGISDHDFVFGYTNNDGEHIEGLLEKSEALQEYATSRPKEWGLVKKALSLSRQVGRHASAFFISNSPIANTVPTMEVGGVKRVTQPDAKYCEKAGLIKYDFLVVSCLKDINLCLQKIAEKQGREYKTGYIKHNGIDTFIWDLPEDQGVYRDLWEGKTETVFQLNTSSVTPFVQKMQPKNIMELATLTSLIRPGPLDFIDEKTGRNMAEEYIERKLGRSKGGVPILDEMFPETYSTLVFQEQITRIAKEIGGMDDEQAEEVREAMGKKKVKLMEQIKPKFIGVAKEKVGIKTANDLWDMMATFGRYGFNCIAGDQLVQTSLGSAPISKICEDLDKFEVKFLDKDGTIRFEKPSHGQSQGIKKVVKVQLNNGSIIEATEDHRFMSNGAWRTLREIIDNDLEFDLG